MYLNLTIVSDSGCSTRKALDEKGASRGSRLSKFSIQQLPVTQQKPQQASFSSASPSNASTVYADGGRSCQLFEHCQQKELLVAACQLTRPKILDKNTQNEFARIQQLEVPPIFRNLENIFRAPFAAKKTFPYFFNVI